MPSKEVFEYVSTLSPEIEKIAREQLEEDEARRNDSILALREWLKKQPHLQSAQIGMSILKGAFLTAKFAILFFLEDKMLLKYLRGCKYSMEKVKTKLDLTLTLRNALPEFFLGWDPLKPEMQTALSYG